jgi:D-alanine-D-alanine ligase
MQRENRSIELVRSTTKALSSMSQRSSDPLMALLQRHFTDVRLTIVNTAADLAGIAERKPDLVFLTVKCVPVDEELGREDPRMVWLADFLDECGVAYTGSKQEAHELELYKPLAKQRAIDSGLDTSPFCVVLQESIGMPDGSPLEYPLFIKPSDRGGGLGVDEHSVVHNRKEADEKIASIAANHQADALVEEYLSGREFSVAVLKHADSEGYSVMPLELATSAEFEGDIMSAEMKASNAEIVLPVTDKVIRDGICALALNIFLALGARDYGRIDIKLNGDGVPQFLEANLMPSLIDDYGSFPKASMLNENLAWEPMILQIVALGLSRAVR